MKTHTEREPLPVELLVSDYSRRPMGTDRLQYETEREIAELLTEIRHAEPQQSKPNRKEKR
jgi:hypothetical protein